MKNEVDGKKKEQLKQIYALFDETMRHFDVVCKEKCAACCTCNVTLTLLEARYLIDSLRRHGKDLIVKKLASNFSKKRFIPKMTTNMFARFCMEGRALPDEENDPSWGVCPLLVEDSCSIYDVRPFGCRALLSTVSCEKLGYARVSPLVLTIQNLFMQAIEHLDSNGSSGNLSDMLAFVLSDMGIKEALDLNLKLGESQLQQNEKISVLMVPPEHKGKVKEVVVKLSALIFES